MYNYLEIIIFFILLVFSAFFSGVETALISLSRLKVKALVKKKKVGALAVQRLKDNPRKLFITILIGNNLMNIGASALATKIAIDMFGSTGVGIATGVVTFLVLIFGEITPKTLSNIYAERVSLLTARPIEILGSILFPIVIVLDYLTKSLLRLTGATLKKSPLFSEEELRTLIEVGAEEHLIERKEKELIEGVLEFNDITAWEVMTPRVKVFALPADLILKQSLKKIINQPYSRVPIYKDTLDNIVGVVYVKDILRFMERGKTDVKLLEIAKKPFFVTEERIINELFKQFQEKHVHIAIVVDEFGGTAGIVTIEDLLEEIVGEIIDEHDLDPELIMRIDKNTIVVHGDTEIEHVNDFFNSDLSEEEDDVTINGLMLNRLKRLPKKGKSIDINNYTLSVEETSEKKILKVRIHRNA